MFMTMVMVMFIDVRRKELRGVVRDREREGGTRENKEEREQERERTRENK